MELFQFGNFKPYIGIKFSTLSKYVETDDLAANSAYTSHEVESFEEDNKRNLFPLKGKKFIRNNTWLEDTSRVAIFTDVTELDQKEAELEVQLKT